MQPVRLWIEGRAPGKARPRFVGSKVYMPERYLAWQNHAIAQMLDIEPIDYQVEVRCFFVNFFSSDSDNLTGSILDCLVKARVLRNDSSSFVCASSGRFVTRRKGKGEKKLVGVLVEIVPSQIEELGVALQSKSP